MYDDFHNTSQFVRNLGSENYLSIYIKSWTSRRWFEESKNCDRTKYNYDQKLVRNRLILVLAVRIKPEIF